MPNRLAQETSPYLQQHASNPVDWYPWGDEALNQARILNKPIFLSIGYAACHWCHVMAHESFEDPRTADLLNEYFVNIKVDREEHPELDSLYMAAVVAMTGQGGWPMTVFLTPELRPFYGGTYFPAQPRHQLPAFGQIIQAVHEAWQTRRTELQTDSQSLVNALQASMQSAADPSVALSESVCTNAVAFLEKYYDWKNGGWGRAPKFPQPMVLDFLVSQVYRGSQKSKEMLIHNLTAMHLGGMADLVAGGFHRYSTDAIWLVPHFEKMLYDNAQLASAYLHGYLLSGDPTFASTCRSTLDFILNEMTGPQGEFYSSLDADTQSVEGATYLWTKAEIIQLLPEPALQEFFSENFIQPDEDQVDEKIVLRLRRAEALTQPELSDSLLTILARLKKARADRPQPARDEKVLTSWNALTIRAFAEAGRYLSEPRYLHAAQRAAHFLLDYLWDGSTLKRTYRNGYAHIDGFLEDYAATASALFSLYQADYDPHWLQLAQTIIDRMLPLFSDPAGGFFDTPPQRQDLVLRIKNFDDNATPSGGAVAVNALLIAANYFESGEYLSLAEAALTQISGRIQSYPPGYACWLQACDLALGPTQQVAVVWAASAENDAQAWKSALNTNYHPRRFSAAAPDSLLKAPTLLADRPAVDASPTAYICNHFTCQQPTTDLNDFKRQLQRF